ncbi:chromosome segregation protein SMC [Tranquillimonas alkanivorans]|uniref:Chromosome partition protein Smc n=1 Tax=Tranquillimonas alkanivorans TaxID=441119 RepID=A0A1I5KMT3_9RHOB|nr:chromosome segregation protein SMC [Tranquillimonas alkanivorans]SFO86207.1 condensin subunit Smc [Tranquillimonas alkanivorans]
MRFTRLRLNGFKSFVDPTDLVINDGLTGVVGPNGCGKSNLLEALRWVMGENRPTAMRGGGMEDVIFAGTATRPARHFAEVSLHIDNSDRLAPAGFNDADMLEIVRRITRDAGSAYKANTKDIRARDVQMMFADASTGAQSPALVRQGQISELINAKPKARRRILEDAAGIGGLYQRRHEAELKLKGAESNLERVQDVVEQLAAQLATLARQAKQAARYRKIGEELRMAEGMLLYRRWRDADTARTDAEALLTERARRATEAERTAREAAAIREEREEALPPLREEEAIAVAVLQKLQVQRDTLSQQEAQALRTIDTLKARIDQLSRDGEREEALNRDAGDTIARLEDERAELEDAGDGFEVELEQAEEAAEVARVLLGEREAQLAELTEEAARLSARHQSARRFVEETARLRDKAEAEAARARQAVEEAEAALEESSDAYAAADEAQEAAQELSDRAEDALLAADEARGEAQSREADARAGRSSLEGELNALKAEAGALAKLVARDEGDGGQVLDLVQVQPGFEKALGAALADDLRAPAIDADAPSGWVELAAYADAPALPDGARPLAEVVTVPGVLQRRVGQVGVVDAAEGARLQSALRPGQRLVSVEGDLWRWDGFRAGGEDAPSAAALRLQQINRLDELNRQIKAAEAKVETAAHEHEALRARLEDLTRADQAARQARRDADARVAEASRALSRAEADRNIAGGKLESQRLAVTRHEEEAMSARARLKEAEAGLDELDDFDAVRAEVETLKMQVEAARITMMTARAQHDELRREGEARTRRAQEVAREIASWRSRLDNAGKRVAEIQARLEESRAELEDAAAAPEEIAEQREDLARSIEEAEARRHSAGEALSQAEAALREAVTTERDAERHAGDAREARAAAEARAEAARDAVAAAAERIAEEQETTPQDLLAGLETDAEHMPAVPALEADVAKLRRQRDSLGAVNLRAEEDAQEVQDEHDTLVREKTDLEEAIRALRSGISALNREGRERLLAAFEQVNSNFSMLFTHLFGGGEAKLVLVESDDPLEAGLEIMCQPPGKKLSTLSLLSGGEQTLTALALIFGVFLANPAPICVLDEVDAPLDDANVTRFCDLLDEMTRQTETRFLIITHHAVTMARMDRLFGVTMGEQGVSQLVSVDLKKAEQLVA